MNEITTVYVYYALQEEKSTLHFSVFLSLIFWSFIIEEGQGKGERKGTG